MVSPFPEKKVEDRVEEISYDLGDLEYRVSDLEEEVEKIKKELDEIRSEIEEISNNLERLGFRIWKLEKEIFLNYEDFLKVVDKEKPIHHIMRISPLDQYGAFKRVEFRVYGISKGGHIVIFYAEKVVDTIELEKKSKQIYEEFYEKYAKPLNSTEGWWE
jgi:chromosome segregation ATPase